MAETPSTDRKLIEQQKSLSQSSESYLTMFPLLCFDSTGSVVWKNSMAEEHVGDIREYSDCFVSHQNFRTFHHLKAILEQLSSHKLLNVRMAIRTKGLGEKGAQNVFCSFSWNNSEQTMTALWEPRIYQLIASLGVVGKAVVEKHSLHALCEVAVNQALQLTNADRAYIKIFDDRIKALRFEAFVSNNQNEKVKEKASDPSRGMTGHVFKARRPYRSANVKQEPPEMYHALFPNTLSALVVPLLESPGAECYGTLSVNSNHADHFIQSDEDFLVVFASHIAIAIRQLQRYEELITTHDEIIKEYGKSRNTITYSLVHDTKNMLRTVVYELETIQKELSETNFQRRRAAELQSRIYTLDNLRQLLDSLLEEMRQTDSEDFSSEPQIIDIVKSIKAAASIIPIANESITIGIENDRESHFVFGTNTKLVPVFYNLITNAVNAIMRSGRGSQIRVVVSDAPQKPNYTRIQVGDDGPGLPKRVLSFIRRGEKYSGIPGGSGLGLITVRATITELAGTLEVESRLGQGTRFIIDLRGPSSEG